MLSVINESLAAVQR